MPTHLCCRTSVCQSSAYSAGPLRPCGLLSLARGPALARALPLLLVLPLLLLLLLLLRLLFCVLLLLLFLLLLLCSTSCFSSCVCFFFCSPEAPKWTPGGAKIDPREGGKMASWRRLGACPRPAPSGRQGRSGAAPGRLLERSWRLLEPSWSALGASWSRLGVPGRSPEGAREVLLGGIFGNLPREAEKSKIFNVFTLFGAFV